MTTTRRAGAEKHIRARRRPRRVLWVVVALLVVLALTALSTLVTPWPGALLVRYVFHRDAAATTGALEAHAPERIGALLDQQYREGDDDAYLDVYFPTDVEGTDRTLPTVIWTHGGAWISGTRKNYAGYYQLLADAGYTVVSVDYTLGPEATYPTAVHQLLDAHAYVLAHAGRLHVDPDRIVLAGDSAGAQLSSQLAAIATDADVARRVGVTSVLRPEQLRGVVLNCGIYDVPAMAGSGLVGWGVEQSLWAYTGERDFASSEAAAQMYTLHHVTGDFPPTYVSGGNGDPLTDGQSKPLAARLTELGVDVTTHFFPADHQPALPHEYQFDLDTADGPVALQKTLDFLRTHTG